MNGEDGREIEILQRDFEPALRHPAISDSQRSRPRKAAADCSAQTAQRVQKDFANPTTQFRRRKLSVSRYQDFLDWEAVLEQQPQHDGGIVVVLPVQRSLRCINRAPVRWWRR